jgi:hypothetical protein
VNTVRVRVRLPEQAAVLNVSTSACSSVTPGSPENPDEFNRDALEIALRPAGWERSVETVDAALLKEREVATLPVP